MNINDQCDKLQQLLDKRGIGRTTRQINASRQRQRGRTTRHARRDHKAWQRKQIDDAVAIGQTAGILPVGLAWWILKLLVEAWLRRYLFGKVL